MNSSYELGVVFVAKAFYSSFLCAVELHCCPKTIKNTQVSHTTMMMYMVTEFILIQGLIYCPATINTHQGTTSAAVSSP